MSVILKIDDIPLEKRKKLIQDLLIKSVVKKKNKQVSYQQKVLQYDMYEIISVENKESDNDTVVIPFSYYYQYFGEFPNDTKIENKISAKFKIPLFERQKEIRQEALDILNETRSLILSLFTGYGKTLFAIYLSCKIGEKTLIIIHRIIIADQWEASIKKACGSDTKVQIVTAKSKINRDNDFFIINAVNLPKRDRYDFDFINTLIVDEAHCLVTEKYSRALFYVQPKYLIGCTATPVRSDNLDRVLEVSVGPNMIYRPLKGLFNVYLYYTDFVPKVETSESGQMLWNSVLESQAKDEKRNEIIVNIAKYFVARNILMLCKRKDHAELLCEKMREENISCDTFMGSQREVNYESRVLVGTCSKLGVGFDHAALDMLVVAGDIEESWIQYLGRVFRKEYNFPIVVILIDKFRPLKKHTETIIKICEESGGEIKNLVNYFPEFE